MERVRGLVRNSSGTHTKKKFQPNCDETFREVLAHLPELKEKESDVLSNGAENRLYGSKKADDLVGSKGQAFEFLQELMRLDMLSGKDYQRITGQLGQRGEEGQGASWNVEAEAVEPGEKQGSALEGDVDLLLYLKMKSYGNEYDYANTLARGKANRKQVIRRG